MYVYIYLLISLEKELLNLKDCKIVSADESCFTQDWSHIKNVNYVVMYIQLRT